MSIITLLHAVAHPLTRLMNEALTPGLLLVTMEDEKRGSALK